VLGLTDTFKFWERPRQIEACLNSFFAFSYCRFSCSNLERRRPPHLHPEGQSGVREVRGAGEARVLVGAGGWERVLLAVVVLRLCLCSAVLYFRRL
jgi:hypothetical protein